jgi:hypothetical protein
VGVLVAHGGLTDSGVAHGGLIGPLPGDGLHG